MRGNLQPIVAGIDIQAEGLAVRLSFSLDPAASAPSSEGSTTVDAPGAPECSSLRAALNSAAEAIPELLAAFQRAHSIVLATQCTLLVEQRLAAEGSVGQQEGGAS